MRSVAICLLLTLYCTAPVAVGQSTQLIKDINQTVGPYDPSSYPRDMVQVGAMTFFLATSKPYRLHPEDQPWNLYRTLGLPGTTILLANEGPWPGPGRQGPQRLYVVGNTVYFTASNLHGPELWKTDGTRQGTVMVKNIFPDAIPPESGGSHPYPIAHLGQTLFFVARDRTGVGLWKSDGTSAGTVLVKRVGGGPGLGLANKIVFGTWSSLMVSDGTANGTVQISTLPGPIEGMVRMGTSAYFTTGSNYRNPSELWKTDGTPGGTIRLLSKKRVYLGLVYRSRLYFISHNGGKTAELWKSDGTIAGTVKVTFVGLFGQAEVFGGKFWFDGLDGLWSSDGTAAGTNLFKKMGRVSEITVTRNGLYFSSGRRLWRTDGSLAGTAQVHPSFQTGDIAIIPGPLMVPGTYTDLIFSGGPLGGAELCVSSGTAASTKVLTDICNFESSGHPTDMRLANGRVLFSAEDGVHGWELWVSDGTATGTKMVADLVPGRLGSDPKHITPWGAGALFVADNRLWFTDGSGAGTSMLYQGTGYLEILTPLGSLVVFRDGTKLLALDGGSARIGLITDMGATFSRNNVVVGRTLYFGSGATKGLWRTDGTAGGTYVLKSFKAGLSSLSSLGDRVYFVANDGVNGPQAHRSDGTALGTVPLTTGTDRVGHLTCTRSRVFIVAYRSNKPRLLVSDGKSKPTVLLDTFIDYQSLRLIGAVNDRLIFSYGGIPTEPTLWSSDGTVAGTARINTVSPDGHSISSAVPGSRYLYFSARDLTGEGVLWRTDGTSAGTKRIDSFRTGLRNARVAGMAAGSDGWLYLSADDGDKHNGVELWRVKLDASSIPYGQGCKTGAASPRLALTDPVLGGKASLSITEGVKQAPGVLLIGKPAAPSIPLAPGCDIFVDLAGPVDVFGFRTDAQGAWRPAPFLIPNQSSLTGLVLALQAAVGSTSTLPFGTDLTNGVFAGFGK